MLEPAELNYIGLNSEKFGVEQDVVDTVRIELTKLSPVNETLEFCVKQVDSQNITELVPILVKQLTSGIGTYLFIRSVRQQS